MAAAAATYGAITGRGVPSRGNDIVTGVATAILGAVLATSSWRSYPR